MSFKVDSDTLNATDQCRDGYSCLRGERSCLCKVESSYDSDVIFVRPSGFGCNYCMSFGFSYVCTCPVRKEIFSRYKK